jgi:hypothetical protein
MFDLSPHEREWLENYHRRRRLWEKGVAAQPLSPTFRRYEIPSARWIGGEVSMPLIDALDRIDPDLEIIFDKFTVVGGPGSLRPGHHLVTRLGGGRFDCNALLQYEVSVQWDIDEFGAAMIWPKGRPAAPGMWFVNLVRKHYVGPMGGDVNPTRRRMIEDRKNRTKEQRAASVKKSIDLQMDYLREIAPYLPTGSCEEAAGRTVRRTGRDLIAGRKTEKVIVDMGG